jgi:hypothetical protein
MAEEAEGDFLAVARNIVGAVGEHTGTKLRMTVASPGRPPIDDSAAVAAIVKRMAGGTDRSIAVRLEKIEREADDTSARRWDDKVGKIISRK